MTKSVSSVSLSSLWIVNFLWFVFLDIWAHSIIHNKHHIHEWVDSHDSHDVLREVNGQTVSTSSSSSSAAPASSSTGRTPSRRDAIGAFRVLDTDGNTELTCDASGYTRKGTKIIGDDLAKKTWLLSSQVSFFYLNFWYIRYFKFHEVWVYVFILV